MWGIVTHWESMYCTEYCLLCRSSKLLIQQRGIYSPSTTKQGWKGLKGWDLSRIRPVHMRRHAAELEPGPWQEQALNSALPPATELRSWKGFRAGGHLARVLWGWLVLSPPPRVQRASAARGMLGQHASRNRHLRFIWARQDIHIFGGNKVVKTKCCCVGFLGGVCLFVFLHIREFQCCEDPVFWKSLAFSNLFCCLLQCYKEIHTCQSSYHWIRALKTRNSVAVNSFYMMGSSNEKRSLSTQCLEVRWMLYKAKTVKTFVQAFWRKDRQFISQKNKNWTRDSQSF